MRWLNIVFYALIVSTVIEQPLMAAVFWIGARPQECTVEGKSITRNAFNKRFPRSQIPGEENVFLVEDKNAIVKKIEGFFCENLPIEYELVKVLGEHENFHKIRSVYIDSAKEQNAAYLIMDYIDGVKLEDFQMGENEPLSRSLMAQLFRAILHVVENNINPFDLAPHNILIDGKNKLRIIDWEGFVIDDGYDPLAFNGLFAILERFTVKNKRRTELLEPNYFERFDDFASLKKDLSKKLDSLSDENVPSEK